MRHPDRGTPDAKCLRQHFAYGDVRRTIDRRSSDPHSKRAVFQEPQNAIGASPGLNADSETSKFQNHPGGSGVRHSAAIDEDRLAGRKVRKISGKIDHQRRDFARRALTPQRKVADKKLLLLLLDRRRV